MTEFRKNRTLRKSDFECRAISIDQDINRFWADFENPNVRIQEFACDIPIEVDFDRYDWQHIVQFSIGSANTSVYNKFTYWKREHDKMAAGFRKSSEEFDLIYLKSLKQMAKQIDVEYNFDGDDIYEEMTIIEGAIEEKLGGEQL